ncbi:MAG: malto-oligosyltrehalose trehalohydrolase [bacterium]
MKASKRLGGVYLGESRSRFRVWAPFARNVQLHIVSPRERVVELQPRPMGYFQGVVEEAEPGTRYFYILDGKVERPDPASEFQPEGVHGPSEVVDPFFPWQDEQWRGLCLKDFIIYELHVGTFSQAGTFHGVIELLDDIQELGATVIELMPVAQFPGDRNWGYDGAFLFAVQNSYGGPQALKELVDSCHRKGVGVILDVVYNHLGPEGNYLMDFGPYFTGKYQSPWGQAINLDGPGSDEVRRFLIENALFWVTQYHLDGLRVDAIHGMMDFSARLFLQELTSWVRRRAQALGRSIQLIAESDLNDSRSVKPREAGGLGFDAQWNDDFHHALHALLTGERSGYYIDFGRLRDLAKSLREGFVYQGRFSRYRQRRHGSPSRGMKPHNLVVFSQNHDQVGNRMLGERLSSLVDFERLKLAAGIVLLCPFVPLLFMGEEYGETAPFLYFTSFGDPNLAESVRKGRQEEFSAFRWGGTIADPQEEATFFSSRLQHQRKFKGSCAVLLRFYKELVRLRKELLSGEEEPCWDTKELVSEEVLILDSWARGRQVRRIYHFGKEAGEATVKFKKGIWLKRMDSWEIRWMGPGSSIPSKLESPGEVCLKLPSQGMVVFEEVHEHE